jgi:hypothetical protein
MRRPFFRHLAERASAPSSIRGIELPRTLTASLAIVRQRVAHAALLVAAAMATSPVAAQDASPPSAWRGGAVSVVTENDKWAMRGDDRHYTNGIRLGWVSAPIAADDGSIWGWARAAAALVPTFDPAGEVRVGIALGQNIYTPGDILRRERIRNDRPYAGWLYAGLALVNDTRRPSGLDTLDTLEVNFGIVGPGAGGRLTQNRWHNFIGVDEAYGWDNQIANEPGFVLYYERKWRGQYSRSVGPVGELGVDATPHVAFSLGNVATYAAVGGAVRIGHNLSQDYGAPRIRPALSGSGYTTAAGGFGWYVFAGSEARLVGYDMFLDGPLSRGGHSVDRRPLVIDMQAGAALTWGSVRAAYTYVVRSREFFGQSTPDRFGALSLTIGF